MTAIALKHPGVAHSVAFPGLSINGFVNAPNAGIAFVVLEAVRRARTAPELDANAIVGELNQQFAGDPGRVRRDLPAAAGAGPRARSAASSCMSRIAPALGFEELYAQVQGAHRRRRSRQPSLAGLFSSFQVSVPQIDVDVDRERVKTYGVPLTDVFETLQVYLGSLYVNDFNRFGRTYQVNVQAESGVPPAAGADRAGSKTRNASGEMVPLGSLRDVSTAATGRIR